MIMSRNKGNNAHLLQKIAGQFLSLGNEKVSNQGSLPMRKKKKEEEKMSVASSFLMSHIRRVTLHYKPEYHLTHSLKLNMLCGKQDK